MSLGLQNSGNPPAVSWLMPVRNGMPYVRETLHAIERQAFVHPHVLLVWDNGSTDGTVEELRRWIPSRIPGFVVTDRPLTVGGSLAELVKAAQSELCARIDADDLPEPERLARQVEFLERHPDVATAGSQVTPIDADGVPIAASREPYYTDHMNMVHQLLYCSPLRHSSVMFRRSAVLSVGNYTDMQPTEDYDLFLRLAARFKLANLPERLVRYRYHGGSISQNMPDWLAYHREVRSRIFARHARALYGLDEAQAARLSCRELRCALPALIRVVWTLERRDKIGMRARFASASFQSSAAKLVRAGDRLTHVFLRKFRGGSPGRQHDEAGTAMLRVAAATFAAATTFPREVGIIHRPPCCFEPRVGASGGAQTQAL